MKKSKLKSKKTERYISVKEKILSNLLGGKIEKLNKDMFRWGNVQLEIITEKQRGNVAMSHYAPVKYKGKTYLIREIGRQSKLYIKQ
jgi:hypothetical protein